MSLETAISTKATPTYPPLPIFNTDPLTPEQWTTLVAITDAIIPAIRSNEPATSTTALAVSSAEFEDALQKVKASSGANDEDARAYLEESVSQVPGFQDSLRRRLGQYLHGQGQKDISFILNALNNRAACLLLTGSTTSFHLQPVAVRQQILLNWTNSYIPALRGACKLFSLVAKNAWVQLSQNFGPTTGFPRIPVHGPTKLGYDYNFQQFEQGTSPMTLEFDAVIIGSGCGGGVTAKNLSEAGLKVLVVEKSYHYTADHYPMTAQEAAVHLFANGGLDIVDDASVAVLSGSTWGGGGTINWSASLQTQAMVRDEWTKKGLPFFNSIDFQTSLDRVCERMGVSTDYIKHNFGNQAMMEGARKLGYAAKMIPQNTGNCEHYCGYCTLGCSASIKQGPANSWLTDAARAGATFIEGFSVEKVLFDNSKGKKRATGVTGLWKSRALHLTGEGLSRQLTIKAPRVIVSCGSIESPLLLLRSGLRNRNIGKNLHLHPAIHVDAVYPDEDVRPWEGGIMTGVVTEFDNLDNNAHGSKIEVTCAVPSLFFPQMPWRGGLDYKITASRYRHMYALVIIARDRDTGSVYPDPVDGRARIKYTPSQFDLNNLVDGMIGAAKIAYVSGATEIFPCVNGIKPFIRSAATDSQDASITDAAFQAWLADFKKHGCPVPDGSTIMSAHQMGSNRMGTSAKNSVVDCHGKVWDTEGLYVMDASVFPSASGVNPMVTNMAISDASSRALVKEWKAEGGIEAGRPRL